MRIYAKGLIVLSTKENLALKRTLTVLGGIPLIVAMTLFGGTNSATAAPSTPDCKAVAAPNVNWSGCEFIGQNFSGVDLSGANLSGTNLSQVIFTGANLTKVNFRKANLTGVNLSNQDLKSLD